MTTSKDVQEALFNALLTADPAVLAELHAATTAYCTEQRAIRTGRIAPAYARLLEAIKQAGDAVAVQDVDQIIATEQEEQE